MSPFEPTADDSPQKLIAVECRELYESFIDTGFTADQAITLTAALVPWLASLIMERKENDG